MNFLYLTLLLPIVGFLILVICYKMTSEYWIALIGVGSIGLSALTALWIAWYFIFLNHAQSFNQCLWFWIKTNELNIPVSLYLDHLSLIMLLIITGVGFMIYLYSSWYMHGEIDYLKFFIYMNLFIAFMLILILADNLLLIYFGWEGVGICSYLLIGFYYKELKNGYSSMKAFIITRMSDIFLILSICILYNQVGTLNVNDVVILAIKKISEDSFMVKLAVLMLLGGAIGKSAQIPLHRWLPEAMLGPTPVSALIHSATMITAGIYLIIRMYDLFLIVPEALYILSIIGSITIIMAGYSAIIQVDIKKILAYSTMSQIGYVFLSLGTQNWNSAIFHLMTHSFFKSLLFLSAGTMIFMCNNEQNIFNMSLTYQSNMFIYVCFLVGSASLSAFPLLTSGYYSKDSILVGTIENNIILTLIGILGSFLTVLYTFRMIFVIFHNKRWMQKYNKQYDIRYYLPLSILLVLSTFIGSLLQPSLDNILPNSRCNSHIRLALELISGITVIIGIFIAYMLWKSTKYLYRTRFSQYIYLKYIKKWFAFEIFDYLCEMCLVNPYIIISRLLQLDPIDIIFNYFSKCINWIRYYCKMLDNEKLDWYIISLYLGTIIILIFLMFI